MVSIAARLQAGQAKNDYSIPRRNKRFFSSPKHPDLLWGPASLLFSECLEFFHWG
jgi:hypothetical protein